MAVKFKLFFAHFAGFEKRRCEANSKWKPEVPVCRETLCPPLGEIEHGAMHLTTLRIGGRATYKCDYGFGLKVGGCTGWARNLDYSNYSP